MITKLGFNVLESGEYPNVTRYARLRSIYSKRTLIERVLAGGGTISPPAHRGRQSRIMHKHLMDCNRDCMSNSTQDETALYYIIHDISTQIAGVRFIIMACVLILLLSTDHSFSEECVEHVLRRVPRISAWTTLCNHDILEVGRATVPGEQRMVASADWRATLRTCSRLHCATTLQQVFRSAEGHSTTHVRQTSVMTNGWPLGQL